MLLSPSFMSLKKERELSYFEPGNLRSGNDCLSNSGTSPHTPVHIGGSAILFGVNTEAPNPSSEPPPLLFPSPPTGEHLSLQSGHSSCQHRTTPPFLRQKSQNYIIPAFSATVPHSGLLLYSTISISSHVVFCYHFKDSSVHSEDFSSLCPHKCSTSTFLLSFIITTLPLFTWAKACWMSSTQQHWHHRGAC